MPKLIVGLGNPGPAYARTRHNAGFLCLERLAERHHLRFGPGRARSELATGLIRDLPVVLARPQTYMNDSGLAVAALARFYDLALADLIVVYDELDLPFGTIRLRTGGSANGHGGMESIIEHLGMSGVPRLRIGIGRPPGRLPPERYVLMPFLDSQWEVLPTILDVACDALEVWLIEGIAAAMNRYNGWQLQAGG